MALVQLDSPSLAASFGRITLPLGRCPCDKGLSPRSPPCDGEPKLDFALANVAGLGMASLESGALPVSAMVAMGSMGSTFDLPPNPQPQPRWGVYLAKTWTSARCGDTVL